MERNVQIVLSATSLQPTSVIPAPGCLIFTMALRMVSSFRIRAVSATFVVFPCAQRR